MPKAANPTDKVPHRHPPIQLLGLNDLLDHDDPPPAESSEMDIKTGDASFQNRLASSPKSSRPDSEEPVWDRAASPVPPRIRFRPTQDQSEVLKNFYMANQNPSTSERQFLADSIGMRYSSVTNWFQNQRSLSKKRREDGIDPPFVDHESRRYAAFPSPRRRSPSVSLPEEPTRSIPRTAPAPYTTQRPKRSRPEPYQLDALKRLYEQTTTPSIEDRTALAQKIGMDLAKVTNWFRNSRQTDRRRRKKGGTGDDDDYEDSRMNSRSQLRPSRADTPSSSSHSEVDAHNNTSHSTDEEYHEAVTPSPPPERIPVVSSSETISLALVDAALYASLDKSLLADAQLLLNFHRQAVH